jgi:transposase
MRRIRWRVEHYGLDAIMDQRGGRPPQADKGAGTIELLCRLKRDVYPDFSLLHFYEYVTEKHGVKVWYNWLRLMLRKPEWSTKNRGMSSRRVSARQHHGFKNGSSFVFRPNPLIETAGR